MKNKFRILLLCLFVLILGTSGIYASSNTREAINNLDTGVVNIKIDEYTLDEEGNEIPWVDNVGILPGMSVSKIPYFTATGNDCYIRATVDIKEGIETTHPITLEDLKGISMKDWVRVGDYFYYRYPLKTNESVDFFHNVNIPSEWGNEENPLNAGNWGLVLNVIVDAIQSENFTPDFESDSPWGDVVIKESIHKDGYDVNTFTTNSETSMSVIVEDNNNVIVKPKDFFEGFKTMVPGDVLTDSVTINSNDKCEIFFTSESLKDIEMLGKMNLKMVLNKDDKDTVIYDATLDARIRDLSLGVYDKGEQATLTFTVSMPEELDNEYTLRDASVKWSFWTKSIEEANKGNSKPSYGNSGSSGGKGYGSSGSSRPKTGDDSPSLIILLIAMVVSGSLAVVMLVKSRKGNKKGKTSRR